MTVAALLFAALVVCQHAAAGTSTVPPSTAPVLPLSTVPPSTIEAGPSSAVSAVVEPGVVDTASGTDEELPGSSPPAVLVWGFVLSLAAAVLVAVFFVRAQRRAARDPGL